MAKANLFPFRLREGLGVGNGPTPKLLHELTAHQTHPQPLPQAGGEL
jgi:hypothetical protein